MKGFKVAALTPFIFHVWHALGRAAIVSVQSASASLKNISRSSTLIY